MTNQPINRIASKTLEDLNNKVNEQHPLKTRQRPMSPDIFHQAIESNSGTYQMVENLKLKYIDEYNQFFSMRLLENLANLKPLPYKRQLINDFNQLYRSLVETLMRIQGVMKDYNNSSYRQTQAGISTGVQTDPDSYIDVLIKDIRTLESIHLDFIFGSSLRYLSSVLEALNMNEYIINLQEFDAHQWAEDCLCKLIKYPQSKFQPSLLSRICKCIKPLDELKSH